MATVLERNTPTSRERPSSTPARISSRARGRLALGALIVAIGVLINLAIYRSVDDKSPVLQLNRDVPAGQQISADDFRTVEIGADGAFRSVPSSDLNTVVGNSESPLILPDERAPLATDVSHRMLSWGMISLPMGFTVSPFVELRSGFPFTRIDEAWNVVGTRNDSRFPLFLSLDLAVEKAFRLPFGLPVRLGLKFFNMAGRDNGRSIQRDVARADFGQTYDPIRRQLRGTLEIAWSR